MSPKPCSSAALAIAALFLQSTSILRGEITYTITDLGTLGMVQIGESLSEANAINSEGEIAGTATLSNGLQHAFLYDGSMHDLGSLRAGGASAGLGINDMGVVVGKSDAAEGLGDAFYYSDGTMVDMHTLPNGADAGSTAAAINASGAIVGVSYLGNGATNPNAFLYTGGSMQDLGDLQGNTTSSYSGALAINSAGIIVGQGQLTTGGGTYEAFIYMGGKMTALPPLTGQTGSNANAINASGEIAGESGNSQGSGTANAVTWSGGTPQLVPMVAGSIASEAFGINDAGQIVGYFANASGQSHAFVCTGGVCRDLNELGSGGKIADFKYLARANAINNRGTIVGYGYRANPHGGVYGPFAFIAKPSSPTVIPPSPGLGILTAAIGDPAPGLGTGPDAPVLSVPGPPAIDKNGDVAFRATIKETSKTQPVTGANDAGIWLYSGTVGSLVARTGDANNPAPESNGALFTKLSDPVLSSAGDLAFLGTYAGGPSKLASTMGVFVQKSGGTLSPEWAVGDPAPGITETGVANPVFASFEELAVVNGGGVAFLATVKGKGISSANKTGIWATDDTGSLHLLALGEMSVPGSSPAENVTGLTAFKPLSAADGQSRSMDTLNGYGAFIARAKSPAMVFLEATRAASSYSVSTGAMTGANPGLTSLMLKSLDEPIVNGNGTVAFLATLSGSGITAKNNAAIGVVKKTGGSLEVQTGADAPDATGATTAGAIFKSLDNPVLNNGDDYAFIGTLEPGIGDTAKNAVNGAGIWTNFGGNLERVARKGDAAPGTAGSYATFEQMVLPDVGGPIFTASLGGVPSSEAQGLWAVSDGTPALILETGGTLQVHTVSKTVRSFSIFQVVPSVMGQSRSFEATTGYVVYLATFTDGTWGIFSVVAG